MKRKILRWCDIIDVGVDKMHLGKRDLRRDDWSRLIDKKIIVEDIKNEYIDGKVCFLNMIKVSAPLSVDSPIGVVEIANNNYKNLIFAPRNKNWWLTVMFDDKNNLIESYFDITKENNFDDEINPYFIDMKLDVCIPNNDKAYMMDEAELTEALESSLITKEEYDIAYDTAKRIIKFFNDNEKQYYEFIWSYFDRFNK